MKILDICHTKTYHGNEHFNDDNNNSTDNNNNNNSETDNDHNLN